MPIIAINICHAENLYLKEHESLRKAISIYIYRESIYNKNEFEDKSILNNLILDN